MKKFLKKAMPIFGASFFLETNPLNRHNENLPTIKEVLICAKTEKKAPFQANLENSQAHSFEKKKRALNETKVFLLVKTEAHLKGKPEKNTLLLLGMEDQLNDQLSTRQSQTKVIFRRMKHYWDKKKKMWVYKRFLDDDNLNLTKIYYYKYSLYDKLRFLIRRKEGFEKGLKENSFLAQSFRGPSLMGQKSGSKSICPVFFDKESAKHFLLENLESIEDQLETREEIDQAEIQLAIEEESEEYLKKDRSLQKNQTSDPLLRELDRIEQTKIICLGLGDFIEHYSTSPKNKALEKVEFLFFPDFESLVKTTKKKVRAKGFKAYQDQLYKSKHVNNNT